MIFGLILAIASFLLLLFYYQRQDKIYIGYTTVLALLFTGLLIILALIGLFSDNPSNYSGWIFIILLWILGSVMIYMTSQLTLAFEKIRQLSQHIALKETDEQDNSSAKPSS